MLDESPGSQRSEGAVRETDLKSAVLTEKTTSIEITNVSDLDINIGDYLKIGSEIVRVKTTVTGNPLTVFRSSGN